MTQTCRYLQAALRWLHPLDLNSINKTPYFHFFKLGLLKSGQATAINMIFFTCKAIRHLLLIHALENRRFAMLNFYELLGITPYAKQQDINTALAQQHSLGKLPTQTLQLAAATLLSEQHRQNYDLQLMALADEHPSANLNSTAQHHPTLTNSHSVDTADFAANTHTNTSNDIVFYDGLHPQRPTQSHHASMQGNISDSYLAVDAIISVLGDVLDVS